MFSRTETNQTNQTEFVEDSAFLETKSRKKFNWKDLKSNKNLLPFYILIGVLFLFFILMILKMLSNKQVTETETTQQTQESVELDPLSQRAEELRTELKNNDPTKQTLPFPQVDLEFNIN